MDSSDVSSCNSFDLSSDYSDSTSSLLSILEENNIKNTNKVVKMCFNSCNPKQSNKEKEVKNLKCLNYIRDYKNQLLKIKKIMNSKKIILSKSMSECEEEDKKNSTSSQEGNQYEKENRIEKDEIFLENDNTRCNNNCDEYDSEDNELNSQKKEYCAKKNNGNKELSVNASYIEDSMLGLQENCEKEFGKNVEKNKIEKDEKKDKSFCNENENEKEIMGIDDKIEEILGKDKELYNDKDDNYEDDYEEEIDDNENDNNHDDTKICSSKVISPLKRRTFYSARNIRSSTDNFAGKISKHRSKNDIELGNQKRKIKKKEMNSNEEKKENEPSWHAWLVKKTQEEVDRRTKLKEMKEKKMLEEQRIEREKEKRKERFEIVFQEKLKIWNSKKENKNDLNKTKNNNNYMEIARGLKKSKEDIGKHFQHWMKNKRKERKIKEKLALEMKERVKRECERKIMENERVFSVWCYKYDNEIENNSLNKDIPIPFCNNSVVNINDKDYDRVEDGGGDGEGWGGDGGSGRGGDDGGSGKNDDASNYGGFKNNQVSSVKNVNLRSTSQNNIYNYYLNNPYKVNGKRRRISSSRNSLQYPPPSFINPIAWKS